MPEPAAVDLSYLKDWFARYAPALDEALEEDIPRQLLAAFDIRIKESE